MKNYEKVWQLWAEMVEGTGERKKKIMESIHEEVKTGIDAIVRSAMEELARRIENGFLENEDQVTKEVLTVTVWSGYLLYLAEHNIDPVHSKLHEVAITAELGTKWLNHYEKDQNKSLLLKIDPVISMFLEKLKQSKLSYILKTYPELMDKPYKRVSESDLFISWAAHQGYIIGMHEGSLSIGEK